MGLALSYSIHRLSPGSHRATSSAVRTALRRDRGNGTNLGLVIRNWQGRRGRTWHRRAPEKAVQFTSRAKTCGGCAGCILSALIPANNHTFEVCRRNPKVLDRLRRTLRLCIKQPGVPTIGSLVHRSFLKRSEQKQRDREPRYRAPSLVVGEY